MAEKDRILLLKEANPLIFDACLQTLDSSGISYRTCEEIDSQSVYLRPADHFRAYSLMDRFFRSQNLLNSCRERLLELIDCLPWLLSFILILGLFYLVSGMYSFRDLLQQSGSANSASIITGGLYRTVTAMFLHADGVHLLGNSLMLLYFGIILSRYISPGLAILSIITAGAGGNLFNALYYLGGHNAIGASTAVFAAIGIMSSFFWLLRLRKKFRVNIHVILIGLFILGIFGFGEGNVDILGHIFGFVCGLAVGVPVYLAYFRFDLPGGKAHQYGIILAMLLTGSAWAAALL